MKLSIIVPVYNAEKYLNGTISNILEQTFTNFELILIDDGSKDSSGIICDEWRKKDPRVKVIHQKNTGVGGARNAGLAVAQGEYIGFVDNDDLIHPQMYDILISIADKENADIVMSFAELIYEGNEPIFETYDYLRIRYKKISKNETYELLYSFSSTDGQFRALWNKIYKKDVIDNIWFPLNGAEDAVFNNKVYGEADNFLLIEEKINLYFWVQRSSSQYHNISSGYQANMLDSQFEMMFDLDNSFPEFSHYAKEKVMRMVLSTRYNFRNTYFKLQVNDDIKKNFGVFRRKFVSDKRIRFSHKIVLLTFYFFPFTYAIFRRVIK